MIYIILVFVLFCIALLVEGIFECKRYKLTRYKLDIPGCEASVKIIMFADLHNVVYKDDNKSIINNIKKINPDFVLIPGDMLVFRFDELEKSQKTLSFLNAIAEITPVYYSLGNHERHIWRPKEGIFTESELNLFKNTWDAYLGNMHENIHLLIDEGIQFKLGKQQFNIFGYDMPMKYYKRMSKAKLLQEDMEIISQGTKSNHFNILLAHNPDLFNDYAQTDFDMICSGHNHGGIMKIPFWRGAISPRLHVFPKYTHGIYKKNGTKMIVTNGLGIHTFKIRINNVPELVYIKIN